MWVSSPPERPPRVTAPAGCLSTAVVTVVLLGRVGLRHATLTLDIGCGFWFGPDMAARIFGRNALGIDPGPMAGAG